MVLGFAGLAVEDAIFFGIRRGLLSLSRALRRRRPIMPQSEPRL
jgi:hypothetical protein